MPRSRIMRAIETLRTAPPGRRFEDAHERQRIRTAPIRLTVLGFGIAFTLAGALTFWIPGPNFVLVLIGLAIVAGQWRMAARALDRVEMALRHWNDRHWDPYPHKRRAITMISLAVGIVLAIAVWTAHRQGWLPDGLPFVS